MYTYAIMECPKCKERIAVQSNETEIKKLMKIKRKLGHARKIHNCPICFDTRIFDYIGYWHSEERYGYIRTPIKEAWIRNTPKNIFP